MVNSTSIIKFKEKLKDVFCIENKTSRKYAEVWLTDVDFGGLYQTNKFVVNVRAEHEVPSCNEEIKYIFTHLFKQLTPEDRSLIWRVIVYNSFEEIHCRSDEISILAEADTCSS